MKRRLVELEIELDDIRQTASGAVVGGVAQPDISPNELGFRVYHEPDESSDSASVSAQPLTGAIQVHLYGTSAGFKKLAQYFLALAELEADADPDYHDHLDALRSLEEHTLVNLVVHRR